MISTVTAATIAIMATIALPASVGIAAAIALIILLATRELASARGSSRLKLLARYLVIAIIPLLLLFLWIIVTGIMEVT